MLTQAASCRPISVSARRSAAARSGRLVNTSSVAMVQMSPESVVDGGVTQPYPQFVFQQAVGKAARFRGEGIDRLAAGKARQAGEVRHQVEPISQLQLAV